MALTQTIPISVAVTDLNKQISIIRRKTNTLIDYYIYPEPTPSAIAAYEPRLVILESRLSSFSQLSYTNLAYLLDDSDALAASYLLSIVDQLLNAVHGIQELFQSHYDRQLEVRRPFDTVYNVLLFRETQLKDTRHLHMTDTRRLKPEDLRPNHTGNFCRGAIQMINQRDRGHISYVQPKELLSENRAQLDRNSGAYLWWECQDCSFRLRYHVSTSARSNIHSTAEVREHEGVKVEYKSAFLTKSHLYQPTSIKGSRGRLGSALKYGCVFCFVCESRDRTGVIGFATGRELATHIAGKHRGTKNIPSPLMLQKFNVAIKGKVSENVRRWDINLI